MILDFAVFRIHPDKHELLSSIGQWDSLTLKPGNWHVMAQGIESSQICRIQIDQEIVVFDPESEVPLILPVLVLRVRVEVETQIKLGIKSEVPYTIYITQLWDL